MIFQNPIYEIIIRYDYRKIELGFYIRFFSELFDFEKIIRNDFSESDLLLYLNFHSTMSDSYIYSNKHKYNIEKLVI